MMAVTISPRDTIDDLNRASAMPVSLTTDDGRRLGIMSWEPHIVVGEAVTVTLTALIDTPEDDDEAG